MAACAFTVVAPALGWAPQQHNLGLIERDRARWPCICRRTCDSGLLHTGAALTCHGGDGTTRGGRRCAGPTEYRL